MLRNKLRLGLEGEKAKNPSRIAKPENKNPIYIKAKGNVLKDSKH